MLYNMFFLIKHTFFISLNTIGKKINQSTLCKRCTFVISNKQKR